jgi:DNA/RNA-binding domain of Phe-tRNA-synthetase-like protein
LKLQITTEILGSYPELGVAYLIGESVDNHAAAASIAQAIASEIEALRGRFADPAALSDHPVIASWQRAYRSMGLNPKRTPPTAQALLRRVLKGGAPPSLSPVVDAYLLAELRFFVPIGGYLL